MEQGTDKQLCIYIWLTFAPQIAYVDNNAQAFETGGAWGCPPPPVLPEPTIAMRQARRHSEALYRKHSICI